MTEESTEKSAIIDMLNRIEWEGLDYWVTDYVSLHNIPDEKTKNFVAKIRKQYGFLKQRLEKLRKDVGFEGSYE